MTFKSNITTKVNHAPEENHLQQETPTRFGKHVMSAADSGYRVSARNSDKKRQPSIDAHHQAITMIPDGETGADCEREENVNEGERISLISFLTFTLCVARKIDVKTIWRKEIKKRR